jgi:hypothetical protein
MKPICLDAVVGEELIGQFSLWSGEDTDTSRPIITVLLPPNHRNFSHVIKTPVIYVF